MIDRDVVEQWVAGYEAAWRAPGTEMLGDLFAPDARYLTSPWRSPILGLADLGRFWDAERDGPEEAFTMTSEVLAVDGDTAVVRVAVEYAGGERWRDLWVVRFDEAGRATHFEEWPFAPKQHDGH